MTGRPRRLLVSVGKVGILDALDREDGRYCLFDRPWLEQSRHVDRPAQRKTQRGSRKAARVESGGGGVSERAGRAAIGWLPRTIRSLTSLYLPMQDVCMDFDWNDTPAAENAKMEMAWTMKPRPGSDGRYGVLEAVDMTTRKPLWIRRTREVPMSSLLATAGGLLFGGSSDRSFRAYDARTGEVLWETRLNSSPNATPITFSVAR